MHYKSSFNALVMPCNAPSNALYDLMNDFTHSQYTYQFIITLLIV